MSRYCRHVAGSVLLILAAVVIACEGGDDIIGSTVGILEINTSTTGVELDEDGYTIQIDAAPARPLAPGATLRLTEVTPGSHTIRLANLAANCAIAGDNPRVISVAADQTTSVTFAVTCSATTGSLRITSTTTGPSPDPDGYTVTIDGTSHGALAPSGETLIDGLTPGAHAVGLGGVSGNCQVGGDNPRTLTVTAGATVESAFAIVCQPPPPNAGTLRVTTATTGPGTDTDGYAFSVDGGSTQPIGVTATVPVENLGTGAHSVRLSGMADHCTLEGNNPRSVTVPGGGTVELVFSLTCLATSGSIAVTTTTSGPNGDTDGYSFVIDGGSSRSIGPNATITVADVAAGPHSVGLSGIAGNCGIQGANPRAVTVTAGGTAVVSFAITCTGGSIIITTNPPVSALSREVFDPVVQPEVEVKDGSGNPVAGAQVTASIASGSGTLEGSTTATTDAGGIASFADLGIRGTGEHTLEFTTGTASVISSPVDVSALPTEATRGKWGPPVNWDIVPLHMSLMPNGKIVAWGKTDVADTMGMPRIWNPAAGPPGGAQMIMTDSMLFCAGHTLMPDGRLMASGGHLMDDRGTAATTFFGPDGSLQRGPNMTYARWYPTVTVLEDGRVLTMGGRDEANKVVTTPEIWEGGRWVALPGAGTLNIPYYPRNFVDPKNGRLFYAGERVQSRWFDVDGTGVGGGRGAWISGPRHVWPNNRDYGSAVMYEAGKILYVGGGGNAGWRQAPDDPKVNSPTATAETIDLNQSSPGWQGTGSMAFPRRHMNATILPDGQVLATGGTRGGGKLVDFSDANAIRAAELWNPATGQWTTLESNSITRVYHSVSLLLPDGTVLHGSSGDAMDGTAVVPRQRNHEIFRPPYLFKGVRPTITSAPANVGYAQKFSVATPNAAQVDEVRWIRLGSVTHAFDASARANKLSFQISGGNVQVTAPPGPRLAPPGHYLLFILNRNGVPSEGKVVRVQ